MREILFRGKTIETGEWIYGFLLKLDNSYCIWPHSSFYYTDNRARVVDSNTIGEWTGMTDSNGRKIFEGDVCDLPGWVVTYSNGMGKDWDDWGLSAGWYLKCGGDDCPQYLDLTQSYAGAVIGNIFDNPEWRELE